MRRYTDQQLIMHTIHDLINDYRCVHRDIASGDMTKYHDSNELARLCDYAYDCKIRALKIFRNRHCSRIGKYGQVI